MESRFLQIHTLHAYPAALLNRDDVGFAKRLPLGGATRLRISSQCLKRHWRTYRGPYDLQGLASSSDEAMSVRSRRIFEDLVYEPLVEEEGLDPEAVEEVTKAIMEIVLGGTASEDGLRTNQLIVLGRPEIRYIKDEVRRIVSDPEISSAKEAKKKAQESFKKEAKKNLRELGMGAGLDAALFGRMVTSDILARCDAAIHVAHAFTVHEEEVETDYFTAVDDLMGIEGEEELGSAHINTSELASGLYYGYVVVDVPHLVSNIEGVSEDEWLSADRDLAGDVVRRLVKIITTVSPGAKVGSTAPYAHAQMVLIECTDAQPRTLANAFLMPVSPYPDLLANAYEQLADYVTEHDAMYQLETERRVSGMHLAEAAVNKLAAGTPIAVPEIADWAADRVLKGTS